MFNIERFQKYFFGYLVNHPLGLFELLTGFLPIIFVLIYFKSILTYSKILVYYSILIVAFEVLIFIYSSNKWNNHFIYLAFYWLETFLLFFYFKRAVKDNLLNKILIVLFVMVSIAFINNLVTHSQRMNNYAGSIQSIAFIIVNIYCYFLILSKMRINKLSDSPLFWFNSACLLYYSGRFFLFLFIEELNNGRPDALDGYWFFVSVFIIIYRLLICVCISKSKYFELSANIESQY